MPQWKNIKSMIGILNIALCIYHGPSKVINMFGMLKEISFFFCEQILYVFYNNGSLSALTDNSLVTCVMPW
jgi:hypothetical protein